METNPLSDVLDFLAPLLGFDRERFERFVCWARYLHSADLHRRHYLAWRESKFQSDEMEAGWELIALQSAYYASLWVVVEGWPQGPLSDRSVDELLAANPRYLDLLKRYRNSVFHYQPSHIEIHKKQFGLYAEGESAWQWVFLLHCEFCRVYWERVPRAPLPPSAALCNDRYAQLAAELASETRQCMLSLVGWIPSDILPARAEEGKQQSDAATALLREAGDFESDAALQLLKVVREAADFTTETEIAYERLKRETIERVKASAQAESGRSDKTEAGGLQTRPEGVKLQ